jgi:Protein of unknown function (DUF3102)
MPTTTPTTTIPTDHPVLAEHAAAIRQLGKRVVADVIEIGHRLTDAKRICGHGNWLAWLKREFGWSTDTAERFIQVHALADQIPQLAEFNLPMSGLYLLAAASTPTEARDEIIERAQVGEPVSVVTIKQTIDTTKGCQQSTKKPKSSNVEPINAERAARELKRRKTLFAPDNVIKAVRKSVGEIIARVDLALNEPISDADRVRLLHAVHRTTTHLAEVFAPEKPADIGADSTGEPSSPNLDLIAKYEEIDREHGRAKALAIMAGVPMREAIDATRDTAARLIDTALNPNRPSSPRDDIGPDSSGEIARLRARVDELEAELRQRDLTIAGLHRRIAELEQALAAAKASPAPPPNDDRLDIPACLRRATP